MTVGGVVFLAVLGVVVFYGITLYNNLVTLKHNVGKAWSNIEVLLKQRHDELPKLVEVCRQYMKFEQETLEKVIQARSRVATASESHDMAALGTAEAGLRSVLGQLFALVEAYPDLKANENFQHLQGRITGLENAIADRRELYNDSVNLNNVRIEQFPDIIVARMFHFDSFELLVFDRAETADVDMKRLFS